MPLEKGGPESQERIDLHTPGEWVLVKSRISVGERKRMEAMSAAFHVRISREAAVADAQVAAGRQVEIEADIDSRAYDSMSFAALDIGIVAWSFADELTPTNIRLLDEPSYTQILNRLNELWTLRTEDERRDLSADGQATSREGEAPPKA